MGLNINKLIDILQINKDDKSLKEFRVIANSYLKHEFLFLALLNNNDSFEKKYKHIYRLSWFIFTELQATHFKWESFFEVSKMHSLIQKYIYEWDIFYRKKIPWSEWSNIAEEGLQLLKEFIESNIDDYKKLPGYDDFMLKVAQRVNDLINSGKYDNEFHEWGKDD